MSGYPCCCCKAHADSTPPTELTLTVDGIVNASGLQCEEDPDPIDPTCIDINGDFVVELKDTNVQDSGNACHDAYDVLTGVGANPCPNIANWSVWATVTISFDKTAGKRRIDAWADYGDGREVYGYFEESATSPFTIATISGQSLTIDSTGTNWEVCDPADVSLSVSAS